MTAEKISEDTISSSAATSITNLEEFVEDDESSESIEEVECSDGENDLHGPCNVRPSDAD